MYSGRGSLILRRLTLFAGLQRTWMSLRIRPWQMGTQAKQGMDCSTVCHSCLMTKLEKNELKVLLLS